MCQSDYKFAELRSNYAADFSKLERDMKAENGKEIVVIAYEKNSD
jgi:hypothetical protein